MPEKRRSTGYPHEKQQKWPAWVASEGSEEPYPVSLSPRSCRGQNRRGLRGSKWSSSVANENSAVLLNIGFDIRPRGLPTKFFAALPAQLDGRGAASEKTAPLVCGSPDAARHAHRQL